MNIIIWLLFGLVAGLIARAVVPGRDPLGLLGTMLLGIVGSVIGGLLVVMFTGREMSGFEPAGLIGAIIGAVVALLLYRRFAGHGRRRAIY